MIMRSLTFGGGVRANEDASRIQAEIKSSMTVGYNTFTEWKQTEH